jgi:DNA ligase 1
MLAKLLFPVLLVFSLIRTDAGALEIMLPLVHESGMEISGWLMSEKLDGVRGYWDGKQLYSKNGIPLQPPAIFTANFPAFALEGEIWGGRGAFEKTLGSVLKKEAHDGWLQLKFAVFDVPAAPGGFEQRLLEAAAWFEKNPAAHAFVIEHRPVTGEGHLREELKRIEELGGEGLMLRKPGSLYAAGRSSDVLKVKSHDDMEAVVIAHLPGQGRNAGRMGSLLVELPDRTRFRLGTGFTDLIRDNPPPVGSLITFKHYGFYESGIPRFPSFLRIRREL